MPTKRTLPRIRIHTTRLVRAARTAMKAAHAPYSNFCVGAALATPSGKIYTGCNIESSSYGLTMCAERTAIFKAISEGERTFSAIAIVADAPGPTPPCGACRQVLMDLAGNIDVLMASPGGRTTVVRLSELLPHAFGNKNLEKAGRKR